jgi:hypothetical protein
VVDITTIVRSEIRATKRRGLIPLLLKKDVGGEKTV